MFFFLSRAVTDPRDGRRVALKKLPNVFQSLVSSKRVFRELRMLCFFKHDNVSTHTRSNRPITVRKLYHYEYNKLAKYKIRLTTSDVSYHSLVFVLFQVLSALDILQPPHIDFFQEMYPFNSAIVDSRGLRNDCCSVLCILLYATQTIFIWRKEWIPFAFVWGVEFFIVCLTQSARSKTMLLL